MPSDKALQIVARVWCDPEMCKCVMVPEAAEHMAAIIDSVLLSNDNDYGEKAE